jgi:spore maturation protein CgeB
VKILLVGGGAEYSTHDTQEGYRTALLAAGHNVGLYALDWRIKVSAEYLAFAWRKTGKRSDPPSYEEVLYHAGSGILERVINQKAQNAPVDWVVIVSGTFLHPYWVQLLRAADIRTAILFTESPYQDEEQAQLAPLVDVCFTHERSSVPVLRQANPNTFYLPHAYDPAKHFPSDARGKARRHDVVFVGTGFWERTIALQAVDWEWPTGINLGLYGAWPMLTAHSKLRRYVRGGIIDNGKTADLYRRAKIGLNLYRTSVHAERDTDHITCGESLNPRALELAACGVFTISDYRPEVAEVFGDCVPVFHEPGELQDLIRYYLDHDDERQALAARLPACVAGQTYGSRGVELITTLEEHYG